MEITVIDGQGGKIGRAIIEEIRKKNSEVIIRAVGTNTLATAAMLKAGADIGATGENPIRVAARETDYIIGPVGILVADSMHGEITPAMAVAIAQSRAAKILLPMKKCINVIGVRDASLTDYIKMAIEELERTIEENSIN